jgi:hypothetical protein
MDNASSSPEGQTEKQLKFSDKFTSAEFKERWCADAVARFKEDATSTIYRCVFNRDFLADMSKEHTHFLRSGGKPLEPGDFVLPKKSWQPDQR